MQNVTIISIGCSAGPSFPCSATEATAAPSLTVPKRACGRGAGCRSGFLVRVQHGGEAKARPCLRGPGGSCKLALKNRLQAHRARCHPRAQVRLRRVGLGWVASVLASGTAAPYPCQPGAAPAARVRRLCHWRTSQYPRSRVDPTSPLSNSNIACGAKQRTSAWANCGRAADCRWDRMASSCQGAGLTVQGLRPALRRSGGQRV